MWTRGQVVSGPEMRWAARKIRTDQYSFFSPLWLCLPGERGWCPASVWKAVVWAQLLSALNAFETSFIKIAIFFFWPFPHGGWSSIASVWWKNDFISYLSSFAEYWWTSWANAEVKQIEVIPLLFIGLLWACLPFHFCVSSLCSCASCKPCMSDHFLCCNHTVSQSECSNALSHCRKCCTECSGEMQSK